MKQTEFGAALFAITAVSISAAVKVYTDNKAFADAQRVAFDSNPKGRGLVNLTNDISIDDLPTGGRGLVNFWDSFYFDFLPTGGRGLTNFWDSFTLPQIKF